MIKNLLDALEKNSSNWAEFLKEDELEKLGESVAEQYALDVGSRTDWERDLGTWLKLGSQVKEEKTYPWPKAANTKYPLLTTASLQFNARANQSLINSTRPVYGKAVGEDKDGKKNARAERISKHMSYQVLHEIPQWEESNDRLLTILPITGVVFKKIYQTSEGIRSDLVLPQNLVMNYRAKNFKEARKTYVYRLSPNEIHTEKMAKAFRDVDIGDPYNKIELSPQGIEDTEDKIVGETPGASGDDSAIGYTIIEQHFFWDLDEDGYAEPYLVKVELSSQQVLQIIPRFDANSLVFNDDNKIIKIKEEEYFVRFPLIESLVSPVYSMGFGQLLGPLNGAINSTINLLLDAGHQSTLQSGFLGKGARVPQGGSMKVSPGKWMVLPTTGDDLRKSIFPLPAKEPSRALFDLLNLLIQAGEETASVADIMKGGNPGQNQPFSTTMAVLEQGLQVFTSIYKRLFRAYTEEYKRIYFLNSKYLPAMSYANVMDFETGQEQQEQIARADYEMGSMDVMPAADPDIVSETQKLIKAESLGTKLQLGLPINPTEATKRWLEAEGHEDIDELMNMPPPQPSPEAQFEMEKFAVETELEWARIILEANKQEVEAIKDITQSIAHLARAENMEAQAKANMQKDLMAALQKAQDSKNQVVLKLKEIEAKKEEKRLNNAKKDSGQ